MDPRSIEELIQIIKEFFPDNTSIVISDTKKYLYYQPSKKIDLKIKPGDEIPEGSATQKALDYGQKVNSFIEPEIFGVPYYGMSIPLMDEGETKGAITAVFPQKPSPFLTNYITIKIDDCWYPVKHDEVIYLETQLRKTFVKTMQKEGYHRLNLSDLELFLSPDTFIRCHRSYIVNINFIEEIQPDSHSTFLLIMKNGTRIPVSQRYASYFRRSLGF
ncbi:MULTISPECIES: LytTR family DNA-binding domain-containing protein [Rummeliibacillus]|uniref:LytTR family DNA-binding domain-containing protein n=1 Tax=Rummeliibacillus TaxID=648802 RepID=UPI0011B7C220|nr:MULTISPECIES: LytTR family DNA-binding domain-containing protein [Rummeliibacillus]MBO2537095.1 LytTR family transcriptional regulator DNA-binding domain-containing protein [Rummeliibacillus suwonensis]